MPAQQDQVAGQAELVDPGLGEAFTVGGEVNDLVVVPLGLEVGDGVHDGLDGHDHARATTEGGVVDFAMLVGGPLPDVVNLHLDHPGLSGAADDAFAEGAPKQVGHGGEDVDAHEVSIRAARARCRGSFRCGP